MRDLETGRVTMVGFVQDITALETAKEERERAEQQRDRLFEISIDLLSVAGFDRKFKLLNPAWERWLGWSEEELLSTPWVGLVHPDDQASSLEAYARLERARWSRGSRTVTATGTAATAGSPGTRGRYSIRSSSSPSLGT